MPSRLTIEKRFLTPALPYACPVCVMSCYACERGACGVVYSEPDCVALAGWLSCDACVIVWLCRWLCVIVWLAVCVT